MLTEIFKGILRASRSAAPIIVIIAAISPLLKKRHVPGLRNIVWLMAKRAGCDMELTCDAAVLNLDGGVSRRDYGRAILSFIDAQGQRRIPLTTGFFGGGRQTLRRFEGIMDSGAKKRGVAIIVLAVAAVAISAVLVGCAGSPAPAPKPQGPAITAADPSGIALSESDPAVPETSEPEPGIDTTQESSSDEPKSDDAKRVEFEEDIRRVHEKGNGAGATMRWALPGYYTIIAGYGERYGGANSHTGIDIGGEGVSGKLVAAATSGVVVAVNETETPDVGYGVHIVIDHGGKINTIYAHLSEMYVTVGQIVEEGQGIGAVGDTGYAPKPHLHFEVREDGEAADPKKFLLSEQDQQP